MIYHLKPNFSILISRPPTSERKSSSPSSRKSSRGDLDASEYYAIFKSRCRGVSYNDKLGGTTGGSDEDTGYGL